MRQLGLFHDPEPEPWQIQFGHPLLKEVYDEIRQNSPMFRDATDAMVAKNFILQVGPKEMLDQLNAARPRRHRVEMDPRFAAVSAYSPGKGGDVHTAGAYFDLDKIHDLTRARPGAPVDSAQARALLRDAMLHEIYGHIAPIAAAGNASAAAPDPRRPQDFARSPIGVRENEIRANLGLPAKMFYGLIEGR